ncbi:cytochrome c biogenesis CcdA family protein [Methylomonas sp. AM2-LC]|uniref:cytochrome c biogenesis CcdA family protein n=1 Tax=Methylomonas sp. AM2-LC TaxID=3153301 RepID=UPI003263A5C0
MFTELAIYGLSLIAGILSTLSPCVLPLLPILAGAALNTHRLGLYALAGGLALSYTLIGLLLAAMGSVLGLDPALVRNLAALLLIVFGAILISERLQTLFSAATAKFSSAGQPWLAQISGDNLTGQFMLGLLLGVVWSPCVGPTLGAAMTLASQGGNLFHTGMVMLFFGTGASLPLIALGSLSQQGLFSNKTKLLLTGKKGKMLFGGLLIGAGILIISGLDKLLEIWILNHAPEWLTRLTIAI